MGIVSEDEVYGLKWAISPYSFWGGSTVNLVFKEVCSDEVSFQGEGSNILQIGNGGTWRDQSRAHGLAHYWSPKRGIWRGPQCRWKGWGCPDPNGGTWRGSEGEQRDLESSGAQQRSLEGTRAWKRGLKGWRRAKSVVWRTLEPRQKGLEERGEDCKPQLVLAAWLDSDFHCAGQNSHNISQKCLFCCWLFFLSNLVSLAVNTCFHLLSLWYLQTKQSCLVERTGCVYRKVWVQQRTDSSPVVINGTFQHYAIQKTTRSVMRQNLFFFKEVLRLSFYLQVCTLWSSKFRKIVTALLEHWLCWTHHVVVTIHCCISLPDAMLKTLSPGHKTVLKHLAGCNTMACGDHEETTACALWIPMNPCKLCPYSHSFTWLRTESKEKFMIIFYVYSCIQKLNCSPEKRVHCSEWLACLPAGMARWKLQCMSKASSNLSLFK